MKNDHNQTAINISLATVLAMAALTHTGHKLPPKLNDVVNEVVYAAMFRHVYMT
jgi:hypothetical protein